MALDGIVVKSIVGELKNNILNAKIDKIYQTEKDEIIISVRSQKNSYRLLISSNPNYPRIHFTNNTKENPKNPPLFCMLLRKHLSGGKIVNIVQPELERIIEIHIVAADLIGDMTLKKIIIEIMGKHSNIILVDNNNKIIDSIKHITAEISRIREVLPGCTYFAPPSGKINPLDIKYEYFQSIFKDILSDSQIPKVLLNNFMGFSTLICNEIAFRYSLYNLSGQSIDIHRLWSEFSRIISDINNNNFVPIIYVQLDGKPIDFSVVDILQYREYTSIVCESVSELIERFYEQRDKKERLKQKTEDINKQVQILLERNIRKIDQLQDKIMESKGKDIYKIWGDLIFLNIQTIEKGQKELIVPNYFSDNQENITIPLNEQLSPSENAQKYYKLYNKYKNAHITSIELLEKTKLEINYLEGILNDIHNCTSDDDIDQIKIELSQQGYFKHGIANKNKANAKSKPLNFVSSDGFSILVGKNNTQNDELTLKIANKNDIWLHTKLIHGSHVIIKADNKEVPDSTLLEAAILASFYSKARNSSNIQVDYTTVKNVKKPSGSKPGMVIYINYKTIVVTPDENLVNKLKKQK